MKARTTAFPRASTPGGAASARESRVVRGIAHDIGNVLAAVGIRLAVLRARARDARDASELDALSRAIADASALAGMLQDGLRQDSEPARPTDVVAAVHTAVDLVAPIVGTGPHRQRARIVVRDDCDRAPVVSIGPTNLRRALVNLLLNAAEATRQSGTIITVRVAVKSDKVKVRVEDTGSGIPRDLLGRLFRSPVTTKAGRDHGFGMWNVRDIVNAHGGTVRARNRPDGGARVELAFPLHAETPAAGRATVGPTRRKPVPSPFRPQRSFYPDRHPGSGRQPDLLRGEV